MQTRKLLALLLSVVMALSLLPAAALAAGTPPTEISKVEKNWGYDIKLTFPASAADWLSNISGISVNSTPYTKVDSSYGVWGDTDYYVDAAASYCLIGEQALESSKGTIVIASAGYSDLTIAVDMSASPYSAEIVESAVEDGLALDQTSLTLIAGETAVLTASVSPAGALIQWSSSDPSIASVENGVVTAVAEGSATITATAGDLQASCSVTVIGRKAAPSAAAVDDYGGYQVIAIQGAAGYVSGIASLSVKDRSGEEVWSKSDYKISLTGRQYYLDAENDRIYFDGQSSGVLKKDDLITIVSAGYEDLTLRVVDNNGKFGVEVYDGTPISYDNLFVRLIGAFEAALVGQQKIDAVSGATTSVSSNKNSDVTVQVAVVPEGRQPEENDWTNLSESGVRVDPRNTGVTIAPEGSGMEGVYSTLDSSLTLSGTPAAAGSYQIGVTLTDEQGRTAESNTLPFRVYDGGAVTLAEQLTLENAVQTQDGKYMYDMEPWAIDRFGGEHETVTVPADIKAWYGSHTSGTYGELGHAVSDSVAVQTLIIPAGCNLTLVNMKILSSVNIVVENGGKLTLRDSSVHGTIEVESGGVFSMNYDSASGEFLTGASINGQLRLHDGAVLENALIYSNTNYLPNGTEARQNTEPVVVVDGDVTVQGGVFIRGDEAPTGTDGETGKSCSGQPALLVENGTLTITEGSVLAAYGGGSSALTSVGGDAILLDNGAIAGPGKLIAVGGSGSGDDGGSAVSGTGSVAVKEAYLEGGNTYFPKSDSAAAGQAVTEGVSVSGGTLAQLIDGSAVRDNITPYPQESYWSDITQQPDLERYAVPSTVITIDGREITVSGADIGFADLDLSDTSLFQNGGADAYLVTIGGETRLVGDVSLKRWAGQWENWQDWIYPDAAAQVRYPYLEQVWALAYDAYIKAFEGTALEDLVKQNYPNAAALKAYWYGMTDTRGVASIAVREHNGKYTLSWLDASGAVLASDAYTMTGKMVKGLEGAVMYIFTADTLGEDSAYRYFVAMQPDMEGTAATPIAAHYHFQFGGDLAALLQYGELYNGTDSNIKDKKWYATMIRADASDLAKYNVILGMHMAEKWSSLPKAPSSGGSFAVSPAAYAINAPSSVDNGSLSVSSRRAAKGSTVIITVTPDEGYELSALTVAGANGGLLALTDRGSGRYAFTMPACAVTVSASFSKISDAAGGVPFTDLSAGAYYYDAVLWAVANGITNGASASAFHPDGGCTRAQVVTFLWRAAGSPSPASSSSPFADVSPDAYYYDAVLWAVENGVTNGTSGASFSPDATVTRAQAVTFLWRYAGAPAGDAGSPFTDVVPGAYYEAAVAWAVASGVTNGITAAAFGPNDPCTRAHIVTFLYRGAEK